MSHPVNNVNHSFQSLQIVNQTRRTRAPRGRVEDSNTNKFLQNFDPERSEREKRKLNRRLTHGNRKKALYDEKGILLSAKIDLCDCLQIDCAGCHFPCEKCNSEKCGAECRNNRKWMYETIENEGSNSVTRNKFTTQTI